MRQHGYVQTRRWVEQLDEPARRVVKDCLRAAVEGPFFPDWEFSALFGLEREEVRAVLEEWPKTSDADVQWRAANGAMNNLTRYPHRKDSALSDYLSVDRDGLKAVYWLASEYSGANNRIRAELGRYLDEFATMDDGQVEAKWSLIRDVAGSAERYGVPVPERVRRIVAEGM